jgi:DNA primase
LTTTQIDLLKRYTRNMVLVFDGDVAGRKASYRNLPEFLEKKIPARVVYLPEGEDPDSFLRKEGDQAFQHLLDGASPLLEVFLREKIEEVRRATQIERKVPLLREMLPLLQKIPDPLEQSLRIRHLAEETGVAEPLLREEMSKQRGERRSSLETPPGSIREPEADWPAEERLVCQILIQFPLMISRFLETNVLDRFKSQEAQRVILDLSEQHRETRSLELSELLDRQEDPRVARLLSCLSCKEEFTLQEALRAMEDAVHRILKRDLQEKLAALNRQIREAEKGDQRDLQHRLFLEKQKLIREEKALLS